MQNYFGRKVLKCSCWPLLTKKKYLFLIRNDLSFQNGVRLYQIRLTVLKGQKQIKSFEVIKIYLLTWPLFIYSSIQFWMMVCKNVYIWYITSVARWEKKIEIFKILMKDKCFHVLAYIKMHLIFDCQQEIRSWF